MADHYFLNGKIVHEDEAQLHVKDLALLRGYGIFDYLRTVNGKKPFQVEKYLDRFYNSADKMGFSVDYSKEFVLKTIQQLLKLNSYEEAGIRLVMTGGYSENSFVPGTPNFFILIEPLHLPSASQFKNGVKLITHEYQREWSSAKTINYLTSIKLINKKKEKGAIEVLYKDNGKIREGSRCNFFIVKDNVLITSKDKVLEGITRGTVIDIAKRSLNVELRDLMEVELVTADECFITGTTTLVTPVVQLDDITIGNGSPGPVTLKLMKEFSEFEKNY